MKMSKPNHESPEVMIDLETLGTSVDSVILTIGAIKFSRYDKIESLDNLDKNDISYRRVDIASCERYGLKKDKRTLDWWRQQPKEVREEAFTPVGRVDIKTVLEELSAWFGQSSCIWSQGTDFDIALLRNVYEKCKLEIPWKFFNARDTRTLFDITGFERRKSGDHNALHDCWAQIHNLQLALKF